MRPEFRIVWLYFTLFPVQRWLGVVALFLSAIAIVTVAFALFTGSIAGQGGAASGLLAALLSFPAIFLLPAVLVAGAAFRALSAPATHRLLPAFRRRVLSSILLFTAIVCGFAMLFVSFANSAVSPTDRLALPLALLVVLGGVSAALYFTFRLTRASRWFVVEVITFVVALQVLANVADSGAFSSAVTQWLLIGLILTGWLGFGFWYMRVPAIAPADMNAGLADARNSQVLKGLPRRDQALTVLLTARVPIRLATAVPGAVLAGVILVAVLSLLLGSRFWEGSASGSLLPSMLMSFGIVSAINLNALGARARYLWLLGCGSRAEILSHVERAAGKQMLIAVLMVATVLASLRLIDAEFESGRAMAILLLSIGFIPLCCYLGLIRCRNFGIGDGALVTVAGLAIVVLNIVIVRIPLGGASVFLISLVVVAAALLVRFIVRRRFSRVDWLEFRVARQSKRIPDSLQKHRPRRV